MPELQFKPIMFSLVCAVILSSGALLYIGRAAAARRRPLRPPAAFLVWAVIFALVYFINRLVFTGRLTIGIYVNLALLLSLPVVLPNLKRKLRRLRRKAVRRPDLKAEFAALKRALQFDQRRKAGGNPHLSVEIMALKRMLQIDPLNAFCFERLSELYEKIGEHDSALRAAQEAVRLDPSVPNRQRLDELQKKDPV